MIEWYVHFEQTSILGYFKVEIQVIIEFGAELIYHCGFAHLARASEYEGLMLLVLFPRF